MSSGIVLTRAEKVAVPSDVRRAVVTMILERGVRVTIKALDTNPVTLDELRVAHGQLRPKTIEALRTKLVEIGALT